MTKKKVVKGSIIDKTKVSGYHVSKDVKTAGGRKAVDCNDKVAKALRGKTLDEVKTVARKNGLKDRLPKWEHLNPGQQRMAIGNALRAVENFTA